MIPIDTDSIVESFFQNGDLQIQNVMTTEKKEDIFSCSCRGDLTYNVLYKFITDLKRNIELSGKNNLKIEPGLFIINVEKEVIYKAQITDDKEKIMVEALPTKELRYAVEQYIILYVANQLALMN